MEKIPYLFKQQKSDYWYVRIVSAYGKVRRLSTKETSRKEAMAVALKLQKKYGGKVGNVTFAELIAPYKKPETNPRYLRAKSEGSLYGREYAQRIAYAATEIEELLKKELPALLKKNIGVITRQDCKMIRQLFIDTYGLRRKTQLYLRSVKTFFSQALEDELLEINPFANVKDIHYEKKKIVALPVKILSALVKKRDLFSSDIDWAFFTILATTGMRLGEVLALNRMQLIDGDLVINRALKSGYQGDIALPKGNLIRVIPLSKITQQAFNALSTDELGNFFKPSRRFSAIVFPRIKATAISAMPQYKDFWKNMHPHALRHSLNSALQIAGAKPILVAEYLSWEHQNQSAIQENYTHVYSRDLVEIANLIDELFEFQEEAKGKELDFFKLKTN